MKKLILTFLFSGMLFLFCMYNQFYTTDLKDVNKVGINNIRKIDTIETTNENVYRIYYK